MNTAGAANDAEIYESTAVQTYNNHTYNILFCILASLMFQQISIWT